MIKKSNTVYTVRVWGEYACYTNPVLKAERYSYDMPTPSALIGTVKSVYWHPGIEYQIEKIRIVKPGRRTVFMQNEIGDYPKSKDATFCIAKYRTQRRTSALKDVEYIFTFRILFDTDAIPEKVDGLDAWINKTHKILMERLSAGKNFCQPYLGMRQFPANIALAGDEGETATVGTSTETVPDKDLGIMFWGFDFRVKTGKSKDVPVPYFFHAEIKDGVINVPDESEVLC